MKKGVISQGRNKNVSARSSVKQKTKVNKIVSGQAINPRQFISLNDLKLPLYPLTNKNFVQPGITPAFDFSTDRPKLMAVKRSDLPVYEGSGAQIVYHSFSSQINQLLDTYTPQYGVYPRFTDPRFALVQSALSHSTGGFWRFNGANNFHTYEYLTIIFWGSDIDQWYYLRCNVYSARCILTVKIGDLSSNFRLETNSVDEEYFGMFVKTTGNEWSLPIEIYIDRAHPDNNSYDLSLSSIQLFQTYRIPTPGSTL